MSAIATLKIFADRHGWAIFAVLLAACALLVR